MRGATLEIEITPKMPPRKTTPTSKPYRWFKNKPFLCDNRSQPNRVSQNHQFEQIRFALLRKVWWYIWSHTGGFRFRPAYHLWAWYDATAGDVRGNHLTGNAMCTCCPKSRYLQPASSGGIEIPEQFDGQTKTPVNLHFPAPSSHQKKLCGQGW